VLDARDPEAFARGHAPGAVHLPAAAWDARAAELPPRDATFCIVAEDAAAAERAAQELRDRGFVGAVAADEALLASRAETGTSRGVLWQPSAALIAAAPHLPAWGRALDVACGSGRNATWLAGRGLATWGVDLLPDALARARSVAAHAPPGAAIAFAAADATRPLPFRDGTFDVVCGFRYLDRALFPRLSRLLKPSGVLVWETFLEAQARFGRPRRPEHLLAEGELEALCRAAGLATVAITETVAPGGPALAAIVARAPAVAP